MSLKLILHILGKILTGLCTRQQMWARGPESGIPSILKTWRNLSTQNVQYEHIKKQVILHELYTYYISYGGI